MCSKEAYVQVKHRKAKFLKLKFQRPYYAQGVTGSGWGHYHPKNTAKRFKLLQNEMSPLECQQTSSFRLARNVFNAF